jgi:hypothetical protein
MSPTGQIINTRGFINALKLLVLSFSVLLNSCNKNTESPVVEIIDPGDGFEISPGDSVCISFQLRDDSPNLDVSIQLRDGDLSPVGPIKRYSSVSVGELIELCYFVEESEYEDEEHFIKIVASDGELEGSGFLQIKIKAVVKEQNIHILEDEGNQKVLKRFDGSTWHEIRTFNQNVERAVFWPAHEQLILLTDEPAVRAYSTMDGSELWSETFVGSQPFFGPHVLTEEAFYISSSDERVRGYDPLGNLEVSVQTLSAYTTTALAVSNTYIITYEASTVGSQYLLRLYSKITSAYLRDRAFPFLDPQLAAINDSIYLLETGSSTSVRCIDQALTVFPICNTLPYEVQEIAKGAANDRAYILENNRIHWVDILSGESLDYLLSVSPSSFSYTEDHLIAWAGKRLLLFSSKSTALVSNPMVGGSVLAAGYF